MKTCLYCKKEKSLAEFPKHSLYKDRLDTRCRKCIQSQATIRRQLHKCAPERPDRCECCRKISDKLCLDHNHEDNTFRGWLCDRCNTGIGKLGDNIKGLRKAIKYLERNKKRKIKEIDSSQLTLFEIHDPHNE